MSSKISQSMRESTVSVYCTVTSRNYKYNPALLLSETAEPTVSLSDTELGFSLLVAIFFFHVHKVNYARIFTVYARILLTPKNYLLCQKLCLRNSHIPTPYKTIALKNCPSLLKTQRKPLKFAPSAVSK